MIIVANEELVARGLVADSSLPCCSALYISNLKASSLDTTICMVKQASIMHKVIIRQVAAQSVRHYMSHIFAIAYSRVVPISFKHGHPKGIANGSIQPMKSVESVTSIYMRSIKK